LEYSATSDLDNLNTADSAFCILEKTVQHLKELRRGGDPCNAVTTSKVKTFIEWTYKVSGEDNGNALELLALEHMDDIITIMVPLATTNPSLVSELNNFRSIMLLTSDNPELVRPYQETKFTAFFRMYTNTFERNAISHGVLRLKAAFEDDTFERCRLIDPSDGDKNSRSTNARFENANKFEDRCQVMESEWVTDESSIIVHCPTYVLSIAAVALVFAAGGLTIGFTVGDRIKGVDPFGIATYAWVLAAFVILICKSMLVRDWQWSE